MRITRAQLVPIRLPLIRPVTGAHGIVAAREGTLVRLETDVGLVGCGEASPYPGFGGETTASARTALATQARVLIGCDVEEGISLEPSSSPTVSSAIETALLELVAKQRGVPLCELLVPKSGSADRMIACNALVSGDDPEEVASIARSAKARGFETFKLKIGALTLERDRIRIAALRELVGGNSKIRLDANQAYREGEAQEALETFAPYDIEYLEQPVAAEDLDLMATLRRTSHIPLAADEAALGETDVRRVIEAEAADVVVIKPSLAGGPRVALRIARAVRAAGLDVVVTSIVDSAVGVAAALHAAAAIASEGELRACGLATQELFELDVASLGAPIEGSMRVPQGVGLGIEEDPAMLSKCKADPVAEISG